MSKLIVISGPSGAGKGTILNKVLEKVENTKLSVSCTTRAPRPGEENGVHYFFISKEEFLDLIENNGFYEYNNHFDNYYGTPKKPVNDEIAKGNNVVLEIDVKGGMNVKKMNNDAVLVFIAPPSLEELKKRLTGRGTETQEQIELRTKRAEEEMSYADSYDYVVVNDDLDTAVSKVIDIINA